MTCEHKNTATAVSKPYKTYCFDCKSWLEIKSDIAKIFESMEGWKY